MSSEPQANQPNKQEQSVKADLSPAGPESSQTPPQGRQSIWSTSYQAIKRVTSLPRTKLRLVDKTTDILLAVSIVLVVLLSSIPCHGWQTVVAVGCDALCIIAVIFFLADRLGILNTLPDRQSVLVWDLAVGALIFGILITINAILLIRAIFHPLGAM